MNVKKTIIQLIANEICGKELSLTDEAPYSDEFYNEMFNTAIAHDVAHIVGTALINNGLEKKSLAFEQYRGCIYAVMFRYENLKYVTEKVCNVLDEEKIPYIPLKGAVVRSFYPQEWMRTGCDIDILVHKEDSERALNAIVNKLGYEEKSRSKHDISILSTENIYIELHYSLLEESHSQRLAKVLDNAWDYAKPVKKDKYIYELNDEMFYFYHVAHMAKHFQQGGCGLRPFIDLWLIERSKDYHSNETKSLLQEGGLSDFDRIARDMTDVWFSGKEHSELTRIMEEYILSGGTFGSPTTVLLSNQHKSGGRWKYILSRIFIPYDDLKKQYPIIVKYKILTPLCEICRLFSLAFGKKRKFRKYFIEEVFAKSVDSVDSINYLFESVGLK